MLKSNVEIVTMNIYISSKEPGEFLLGSDPATVP